MGQESSNNTGPRCSTLSTPKSAAAVCCKAEQKHHGFRMVTHVGKTRRMTGITFGQRGI